MGLPIDQRMGGFAFPVAVTIPLAREAWEGVMASALGELQKLGLQVEVKREVSTPGTEWRRHIPVAVTRSMPSLVICRREHTGAEINSRFDQTGREFIAGDGYTRLSHLTGIGDGVVNNSDFSEMLHSSFKGRSILPVIESLHVLMRQAAQPGHSFDELAQRLVTAGFVINS